VSTVGQHETTLELVSIMAAGQHEETLELVSIMAAEVGLLVLVTGCVVWHWLFYLFYEKHEGKRRKNEERRQKRKYRGPPWVDPEV
jgi:hypothetical protein